MNNSGIHPWSHGSCPEDFGWVFDETGANVTAFTIDSVKDHDGALLVGIPESVLARFEDDYNPTDVFCMGYGYSLLDWLQAGY